MHQQGRGGGGGFVRGTALALLGLVAACPTEPTDRLAQRADRASEELCTVQAPNPGVAPELQWAWSGSTTLPDYHLGMGVPAVVDVNGDHVPDVVFNASRAEAIINIASRNPVSRTAIGGFDTTDAVLRVVRGDTGQELFTVTDADLHTRGGGGIAAGDLDGDGRPELCTLSRDARGIFCFRHTGELALRIVDAARVDHGGELTLADLDGDGKVEILDGNRVYNRDGTLRWAETSSFEGATSIAADLDLDGLQEVITGAAIYRQDGKRLCLLSESKAHGVAAGNFDGDPQGELVVTSGDSVALYDTDCTRRWVARIEGASFFVPNLADFDGDGQPEIGVGGAKVYAVFEADGTLKWKQELNSASALNSTTFDFDADGKLEVVLTDETDLFIRDGATGALRAQVRNGGSYGNKAPIVVDVDGDGSAEIVVANGYPTGLGLSSGVRVYRGPQDGWPGTRRVWNQLAYSVTHVNDNGTLPARPAINWLASGLNTFLQNPQFPRSVPAADLAITDVSAKCEASNELLHLTARVDNQGDASTTRTVNVAFYAGNPASGGTLLGVSTLTDPVEAGAFVHATLTLSQTSGQLTDVYVVADDDGHGGGHVPECREGNNTTSKQLELRCGGNQPPVAVCRDVTVTANAQCQGSASVDNGCYDPDNGPRQLSISQAPGGLFGLGSHAVTLTAFDGQDSARCVGTVTVVDTTPPAITCPTPQVLECQGGGAVATFSASASDNCGAAPTTCTPASGSTFPLGQTQVDCSAQDGSGNAASCGFAVTVRDTLPPVLGAQKNLTLRPPNHQHVTVSLEDCAANAQDACGGALPLNRYGRITRVTSDEVEDGRGNGDGRTCADIQGLGTSSVQVRAEREGSSDGRVYTLHYTVTDASGNSASGTCRVNVPHDGSGRAAVDSGVKYCVGQDCPAGTGGSALCQ